MSATHPRPQPQDLLTPDGATGHGERARSRGGAARSSRLALGIAATALGALLRRDAARRAVVRESCAPTRSATTATNTTQGEEKCKDRVSRTRSSRTASASSGRQRSGGGAGRRASPRTHAGDAPRPARARSRRARRPATATARPTLSRPAPSGPPDEPRQHAERDARERAPASPAHSAVDSGSRPSVASRVVTTRRRARHRRAGTSRHEPRPRGGDARGRDRGEERERGQRTRRDAGER